MWRGVLFATPNRYADGDRESSMAESLLRLPPAARKVAEDAAAGEARRQQEADSEALQKQEHVLLVKKKLQVSE